VPNTCWPLFTHCVSSVQETTKRGFFTPLTISGVYKSGWQLTFGNLAPENAWMHTWQTHLSAAKTPTSRCWPVPSAQSAFGSSLKQASELILSSKNRIKTWQFSTKKLSQRWIIWQPWGAISVTATSTTGSLALAQASQNSTIHSVSQPTFTPKPKSKMTKADSETWARELSSSWVVLTTLSWMRLPRKSTLRMTSESI